MANPLPYPIFINSLRGLPLRDIQSFCSTNQQYSSYCRQPQFWNDLSNTSFEPITNLPIDPHDYEFIRKLMAIIYTPSSEDLLRYPYIAPIYEEVFANFKSVEIVARLGGDQLRYWTINPTYYPQDRPDDLFEDYRGIFFPAYTFEGAMLRAYQYALDGNYLSIFDLQLDANNENLIDDNRDLLKIPLDQQAEIVINVLYTGYEEQDSQDPNGPYFIPLPRVVVLPKY